jgi:hypothetical protein
MHAHLVDNLGCLLCCLPEGRSRSVLFISITFSPDADKARLLTHLCEWVNMCACVYTFCWRFIDNSTHTCTCRYATKSEKRFCMCMCICMYVEKHIPSNVVARHRRMLVSAVMHRQRVLVFVPSIHPEPRRPVMFRMHASVCWVCMHMFSEYEHACE